MVGVGGRSILPACGGKTQTNGSDESYLGRFPFVRSDRPKRTGSGQFQWKGSRCARTFSRQNSPNSRALADRSGETERL